MGQVVYIAPLMSYPNPRTQVWLTREGAVRAVREWLETLGANDKTDKYDPNDWVLETTMGE